MDSDLAGAVLGRAFFTDPAFTWAIPDGGARAALGPWFAGIVRWGQRYGEVTSLGDGPQAVAVWGRGAAGIVEQARVGMVQRTLALGPRAAFRLVRLASALTFHHVRLCAERHLYLYMLGVDPPFQRGGRGSALLRPTLLQADQDHLPTYLETATPSNVPFYERLGFEVLREGDVVESAPRFWLMKRPARGK